MDIADIADYPSGYEEYVYKKDREYSIWKRSIWSLKALYDLVSDKAGECQAIPPEEWNSPITVSGASQDCQKQMEEYPGGITGEEGSVFDVMASEIGKDDHQWTLRFGDDLLYCDNSLFNGTDFDYSAAVESACWPNDNPILDGKYNFLRITMKVPLRCEKLSVLNYCCDAQRDLGSVIPLPMKFMNATIVMDWPICSDRYLRSESFLRPEGSVTRSFPWPTRGARIVDPSPRRHGS